MDESNSSECYLNWFRYVYTKLVMFNQTTTLTSLNTTAKLFTCTQKYQLQLYFIFEVVWYQSEIFLLWFAVLCWNSGRSVSSALVAVTIHWGVNPLIWNICIHYWSSKLSHLHRLFAICEAINTRNIRSIIAALAAELEISSLFWEWKFKSWEKLGDLYS